MPLEQRFRSGPKAVQVTNQNLYPGLPCAVVVCRGKLVAIYERALEKRWGFVADHSSLPPDASAADVYQCRDGLIRAGMNISLTHKEMNC